MGANIGEFEWLEDNISIHDSYVPQFNNQDIISLREARQKVGEYLSYINEIRNA